MVSESGSSFDAVAVRAVEADAGPLGVLPRLSHREAQLAARRLLEAVPEFRITQNALFRGLAARVPGQAAAMQDAAVASGIPL